MSITGQGNASKEQVASMLQSMLNIKEMPKHLDASDGLAAAVCHFFQRNNTSIKKNYSGWNAYIKDNPKRKPAAPAFNSIVEKEINDAALNRKLFSDLGDNLSFEGSMRNFYSMPNTSIPNSQEKFAQYCYGDTGYCRNQYKTVAE